MKRFFAFLLALLMLASAVACASGTTGEVPSQSSSESESESKDNTDIGDVPPQWWIDRENVTDGIGEYDAGGITVTIDAPTEPNGVGYKADWLMEEAFTSSIMNNALYQRLIDIEERFKVNVKFVYPPDTNYITDRTNTVMAGLGELDLIGVQPWAIDLALAGVFDDQHRFSVIDFSRPWWFGKVNKEFELNGVSIISFGSAPATSMFGGTEVFFFNKQLCEANRIEDLYQVVRDNRWTYDYIYKIAKDYYFERDGIEGYTEGDQYGLKYHDSFIRMFWNFGGVYIERSEETGLPVSVYNRPENIEIYEKLRDLISIYDAKVDARWFDSGTILMRATNLRFVEEIGAVDFDIGILPMPKFNEYQDNYIAAGYLVGTGITIDSKNPETTAVVLEALAYYGWKDCVPKYYETVIKYRYSSDPQNAEMLDLMYSNMTYDPTWLFDRDTVYELGNFMNTTKSAASFAADKYKRISRRMQENVKMFQKAIDRLYK